MVDTIGNTIGTASLAIGAEFVSTIDTSGDSDWFAVSLVAGQTYHINLTGDSTVGPEDARSLFHVRSCGSACRSRRRRAEARPRSTLRS